jgi:hypothetical protein
MVIVTVDAPDPAGIVADGLKAQLLPVRVGSVGEKAVQLRFTAVTKNVDPEVGVTVKL